MLNNEEKDENLHERLYREKVQQWRATQIVEIPIGKRRKVEEKSELKSLDVRKRSNMSYARDLAHKQLTLTLLQLQAENARDLSQSKSLLSQSSLQPEKQVSVHDLFEKTREVPANRKEIKASSECTMFSKQKKISSTPCIIDVCDDRHILESDFGTSQLKRSAVPTQNIEHQLVLPLLSTTHDEPTNDVNVPEEEAIVEFNSYIEYIEDDTILSPFVKEEIPEIFDESHSTSETQTIDTDSSVCSQTRIANATNENFYRRQCDEIIKGRNNDQKTSVLVKMEAEDTSIEISMDVRKRSNMSYARDLAHKQLTLTLIQLQAEGSSAAHVLSQNKESKSLLSQSSLEAQKQCNGKLPKTPLFEKTREVLVRKEIKARKTRISEAKRSRTCILLSCPLNDKKYHLKNQEYHSFYRIPGENRSEDRKDWLFNLKIDETLLKQYNRKENYVCDRHFLGSDFSTLNLKRSAVPTQNIEPHLVLPLLSTTHDEPTHDVNVPVEEASVGTITYVITYIQDDTVLPPTVKEEMSEVLIILDESDSTSEIQTIDTDFSVCSPQQPEEQVDVQDLLQKTNVSKASEQTPEQTKEQVESPNDIEMFDSVDEQ